MVRPVTQAAAKNGESQAAPALGAESSDDDSKSMPQSPWWTTETRTSYSVINNYVQGDEDVAHDSVTLTTQGSFEFLPHVVELCRRWEGPVSLAVYAPGDDLRIALELIFFLRKCRDACVRARVAWHMVFDASLGPRLDNVSFPDSLVSRYRKLKCDLTDEEVLKELASSYRERHSLPYPINVARNVARLQSRTKYLLASDIELYPSLNVVSMFKVLLEREESNQVPLIKRQVPHVYHLPIFEVETGLEPPQTKSELMDMFRTGDAIFFHRFVCDICQNFPDREQWLQIPGNGSLNVFRVTKRTRSRSSWEPLYIGTNAEPLYDERLTWEGKRDKMSQMYEMCLMDYDILVLDNAFLVHAPGIKHIDEQDSSRRLKFIKRNNQVYNTILAKLRKKYGSHNACCLLSLSLTQASNTCSCASSMSCHGHTPSKASKAKSEQTTSVRSSISQGSSGNWN